MASLDAPSVLERMISLFDDASLSSTYKPALLLALVDRAPEHLTGDGRVPVAALAERVAELYWPQTLPYATSGVLVQNKQGGQAGVVRAVEAVRSKAGVTSRALPQSVKADPAWAEGVEAIERALAEWPIPRVQRPFEPFLFDFDWPFRGHGGWSRRAYEASSRELALRPNVAEAFVRYGALLRPSLMRWWTTKAAELNPEAEDAKRLDKFESFLFERDRAALGRVREGLFDLQGGECFFCAVKSTSSWEVDHFVPWSRSGDDGLDNLVVACRACNNDKRADLADVEHLSDLLQRNERWSSDLSSLATERTWLRDATRSSGVRSAAYLIGSGARLFWRAESHGDYTRSPASQGSLAMMHDKLASRSA